MEYELQIKAYIETVKNEFSQINDYNTKVISFGYVAFFAIATYVKDLAPRKTFIISILLMSASITLFIIHELCRALYFSRYSSSKAKALEALPENSLLQKIDVSHTIACIRFQKLNLFFFWPSSLLGVAGLVMLFLCYLNIITG
jgi:hypothetical protein